MHPPLACAGLISALLALHAASAPAQLYKWVDALGVVNYSNWLPADPQLAEKVTVVESSMSVYTPDPALVRAMAAERQRIDPPAYDRQDLEQPAVVMIGAPAPAPLPVPQTIIVIGYPYAAGIAWKPRHPLPPRRVPQVKLPHGAIAGNTVGLYSIIPGSSSPVPGTWSPIAPQVPSHHRPAPLKRHSWQR